MRARKSREKPERHSGSAGDRGPTSLRSNKRVRFEEEAPNGEAAERQRKEEEDAANRESRNTGGSSGSNDTTPDAGGGSDDEKFDEGRDPEQLASPEGPSRQERETHNLTHIPFRSWCEHRVKGRARKRPHKRRNPEVKKEELKKATRIYMDFYYNGIGERE